jgi:predicted DNA-binding protein (MmcQ/YjbR family)
VARTSPAPGATWKHLREYALSLPEAVEEFPWGDRVAKVRKKIFIFLGEGAGMDACISLKLHGDANAHALSLPGVKPTAYNLGKAGWVTIPVASAPRALLLEWVRMSYMLVAPKRLGVLLDGG